MIDTESLLIIASITVLMAISIYLPMAAGDLFMLPIATMAIGAYVYGVATIHGWPPVLAFGIAAFAGVVTAAVGGALVLRLTGFSTALASLAMALIVQVFFTNFEPTGGVLGMAQIPSFASAGVTITLTGLFLVGLAVAERSRLGRTARAILQDSLAAEAVGVDVRAFRLALFAASGGVSALAGALTAGFLTFVDPSEFGFSQLNGYVLAAMLGGTTTFVGPVIGGTLTTVLPEFVRFLADYRLVAYSLLVIVVVLVRKEGLVTSGNIDWVFSKLSFLRRGDRAIDGAVGPLPPGARLEALGFSKAYGGQHVLRTVSVTAEPGSILVIIGPNGAGKTTLLNAITATIMPDEGVLRIDGRQIRCRAPHDAVRNGIARTFQNLRVFGELTVAENVSLRDPRSTVPLLDFVGLSSVKESVAKALPYGKQRRLEIARALQTAPRVLLLDEPTAGMSHSEAEEIGRLLQTLKGQGATIVLIDHNLRFVMQVADRVVVLDAGEMIAEGTPEEVSRDPKVIEAYLGSSDVFTRSIESRNRAART